ncbi:hypothetical protein CSOJ01_12962 [Colletotrichum sojae]|uniref:Uncharacterized protein n=1 Tax=Colletotrichum sojae TaxID=2175907 RepID=A0A8H6ITJ1_9PEZI|nr:hypothetical protein CSOJ01_12962 [Colletotrichum sojae]
MEGPYLIALAPGSAEGPGALGRAPHPSDEIPQTPTAGLGASGVFKQKYLHVMLNINGLEARTTAVVGFLQARRRLTLNDVTSAPAWIPSTRDVVRDSGMAVEHELAVPAHGLPGGLDAADDGVSLLGECHLDLAGVDYDVGSRVLDADAAFRLTALGRLSSILERRRRGSRNDILGAGRVAGGDGVAGPLDGVVAPVSRHPGLEGYAVASRSRKRKGRLVEKVFALGPRDAERGARG